MLAILFSVLVSLTAAAQEVRSAWPQGTVSAGVNYARVLFDSDKADEKLVGKEIPSGLIRLEKGKLKRCYWEHPRLAFCDFESALGHAAQDAILIGTQRFEFSTPGLFVTNLQETDDAKNWRLKVTFSGNLRPGEQKVHLRCGGNSPQILRAKTGQWLVLEVPKASLANQLCQLSFSEGVLDSDGTKHEVPGAWRLQAGRLRPTHERGGLSVSNLSCGQQQLWNVADRIRKGETSPVLDCSNSVPFKFSLYEAHQKQSEQILFSASRPGIKFKADKWNNISFDPPANFVGSVQVSAFRMSAPEVVTSFIAVFRPASEFVRPYTQLVDDGSYFEATPPYLLQLNHRITPLIELSVKRLSDPAELLRIMSERTEYWSRPSPRTDLDSSRNFLLETEQGNEFKTGLDLSLVPGFGAGVWWVQSQAIVPTLAPIFVSSTGDQYDYQKNATPEQRSAAIVQFSDLGIHLKVGRQGGLAWVFRLSSGKAVRGAEVRIWEGGKALVVGKTAADGTVSLPPMRSESAKAIVAHLGEEIVAMPLSYQHASGISTWDFNLPTISEYEMRTRFEVIPSNPMYRPGDRVQLKVFGRKHGLLGPEIPSEKEFSWSVIDARGERAASGKGVLSDFGTADINFKLESEAPTGKYSLSLEQQELQPFSVEVYRAATLKVNLEEPRLTQGKLAAAGKVEFHVGGGVKDISGELVILSKERPFTPPDAFAGFTFSKTEGGSVEVVGKSSFVSNSSGDFQATLPAGAMPEYGSVFVEASVMDGDGAKVSARRDMIVSSRGWFVGVSRFGYYQAIGEKIKPQIIVLDEAGKPLAGVKLKATLVRRYWNTVRRLGSGNAYYYDSEEKSQDMKSCELTSGSAPASCDFVLTEKGSYQLRVSATKDGKSDEVASSSVWAHDDDWGWLPRRNHDRIDVAAEKASYEFGEKARIFVQSPYAEGEALVTIERYGVIRHEVVKYKGSLWSYELKLDDPSYVPGLYVSVVLLKGRSAEKLQDGVDLGRPAFKLGYTKVNVKRTPQILQVKARAETSYLPGEEVKLEFSVKDWKNQGVDAELAVTVVDDAVLQLVPSYKRFFEVMDGFYTLQGIGVWNYQTLTRLVGRRSFGKKGADAGGGGGNGADALRSNFKTVAKWEPKLEVKNGKAQLKFKLPDNLTAWRVIAVAVDKKSRFGEGETLFRAVKPLMLHAFLPPFLREGDKFQGSFGIQNMSEKDFTAQFSAELTGLTPAELKGEKSVAVGARELIHFDLSAPAVARVRVDAKVKAQGLSDGLRTELEVLSKVVAKQVEVQLIPLTGNQKFNFTLPKDAVAGTASMDVKFSKSLLDGLDDAYAYVVGYPYGCWEQLTTGALFLAQYKEMQPWLVSFVFDESKQSARDAIQEYLNRAGSYQRADGSMGYYPGDYAGDPYLTVFTGFAFNVFKSAGFQISPQVSSRLKSRLQEMLTHSGEFGRFSTFAPSMKAFIAAILTEAGEQKGESEAKRLFTQRDKMDLFGRGMLLRALPAESVEAKKVAEELLSNVDATGQVVVLREHLKAPTDKSTWDHWLHSSRRSECVAATALLRKSLNPALAAKIVQGLRPAKSKPRWSNTQENFFCFEAFRTYAGLFESTAQRAEVEWLDGAKKTTYVAERLKDVGFKISEAQLAESPTPTAKLLSGGSAYVRTRLSYASTDAERASANGFGLKKHVYRQVNGAWSELKESELKLKKGETVKIVLEVRAVGSRVKVGMRDPLPASWRAVNPRLATSSLLHAGQTTSGNAQRRSDDGYDDEAEDEGPAWWDYDVPKGFLSADMRLSSVQFYADELLANQDYTVEYFAQVATVGEFSLPGAIVEEMYDENNFATTPALKVHVVE